METSSTFTSAIALSSSSSGWPRPRRGRSWCPPTPPPPPTRWSTSSPTRRPGSPSPSRSTRRPSTRWPRAARPSRAVHERPRAEPPRSGLPSTPPQTKVAPLDEISMQYTSGTTSKPKGVLLTPAHYLFGGEAISKSMRVGPTDRHLIVLPLFHAGAQVHAFIPTLIAGGSVALMERFSATRFVEQAIRHEATLAALFAAPIRMLLAQPATQREGQ